MIRHGTGLEKTQSLTPSTLSMKSQPYQIVPPLPMIIMVTESRKQRAMIPGITPMIMLTGS